MSIADSKRSRGFGQWAVAGVFGLLAGIFCLRFLFNGYKWLGHAVDGDTNFKVLTLWCLLYMLVCAAIAWVAYRLPREQDKPVDKAE